MNLYLIKGRLSNKWDVYTSAVVVAESAEAAKNIHPSGGPFSKFPNDRNWVEPNEVQVERIGVAAEHLELNSVICADFTAG